MKNSTSVIVASALTLALCIAPLAPLPAGTHDRYAKGNRGKQNYPVRLELVSPRVTRGLAIQHHAGWPLTFKIVARGEVSLVVPTVGDGAPSEWPEPGATSFLMLKDLDGCPSAGGRLPLCFDVPDDELWIEFTPDQDSPNVVDTHGFDDLRVAMKDPTRRPTVTYKGAQHTFGPKIHETLDGLGYGANDDLTGFVLLADAGVSIVSGELESFFGLTVGGRRVEPLQNRNLAGFMTSVGYELSDTRGHTTITTSVTVPRHLTSRVFLEDQCMDDGQGGCEVARIVDGGPLLPAGDVAIRDYDVTLRAFMVLGVAPAVVTDCNGDGEVGAADAECMGYQLLSRELTATYHQTGRPDVCNRLSDPWGSSADNSELYVDFDGNGDLFMLSCPGGSSGGGSPPRQRQSRG